MKKFTSLREIVSICSLVIITIFATTNSTDAQVIRPYGAPLYSDNLHGGHTIFGNTITAIYTSGSGSTGVVNTTAMNDFSTSGTGNYTNSRTSAYSNNNANIQYVDVDGGGSPTTLIATGAQWNYSNANSQPASWPNISTLPAGPGASPLGFGPTGTVGTDLVTDRRAYYFTRTVNINPSSYAGFTFNLTLDDGAVIYVNGTEVGRYNMPSGTPSYNTNASSNVEPEANYSFSVGAGSPFINGNNTIQVEVHKSASNESGTDDLFFNLELIGNGINSTFNSSSADLIMPAGSNTIKFARLYWGGRIDGGTGGSANINLRTVKIRKGTSGAYTTITAPVTQVDKSITQSPDSAYQSYVDVTTFVNNNGAGTYTVADVTAATGTGAAAGNYAAWSIVVVYENPTVSYNSVRVYDGFLQIFNGGPLSITLTGLNVPSTPLLSSDAYMTALSWEGDANLAVTTGNPLGDYIKVNGNIASAGVNLPANFWNGTISKNGVFVTTKNPDFKNQMSIDIDELEVGVGYGISGNATQVNIEFGSEADQYFPSLFAFTIKSKDPDIILNKSVSDGTFPFGVLQTNELLTYTLSGSNIGLGNALNCVVVDSIPSNVTYEPGTLIVVNAPGFAPNSPQTDANDGDKAFKGSNAGVDFVKFFIGTGATNAAGGTLAPDSSYTLRFKVRTPATIAELSTVVNTARITGQNIFGDIFVDDGTATFALGAPTPVKMTSFTVKKENSNAVLRWTTSSEIKNDHFEIERSVDGLNFSKMGEVIGNGTTALAKNYSYPDALINVSSKILYYRLRIVDIDAKSTFSQIVALRLDGSIVLSGLTVYPNPFTSNIKLQLQSSKEESSSVRLINMNGQEVVKRNVILAPGQNIVIIKDLESVAPGIYMMELRTGGDVITQKIMKK